jgi:hypothetical protein
LAHTSWSCAAAPAARTSDLVGRENARAKPGANLETGLTSSSTRMEPILGDLPFPAGTLRALRCSPDTGTPAWLPTPTLKPSPPQHAALRPAL